MSTHPVRAPVARVAGRASTREATHRCASMRRPSIRAAHRIGVSRRVGGASTTTTVYASSASMSLDDDDDGMTTNGRTTTTTTTSSRAVESSPTMEIRRSERAVEKEDADEQATTTTASASAEPLTYENAALERDATMKPRRRGGVVGTAGSTMRMLGSEEEVGADASGSDGSATGKPLKINQDLALYRARTLRNKAGFVRSKEERNKMRLEAIAGFEKAMAYDVTDGRAYCGIGQILVKMRKYDEARRVYQAGCDACGGDNAYLWQAFAVLEEKSGNIALARKYYDASTAADKTHAAGWHGWGTLEKNQGNYQRARELYLKGVRLVPPQKASAHLYHSLGVMALERGRISEAREHFRQGVRTESGSKSAAIWQSWGILEANAGDEEQARKLFQKGLVMCPKSKYIWLAWGVWEAKIGYVERAKELLTKGCRLNPQDTFLLQALAKLEAEQGNMDTARRLFEQGTVMDPRHQPNWNAWAMAEWRAGEVDRARNLFQRGVWVDPKKKDAARLFHAWAVLEEREDNISLARQLYKCAVKVDSSSERIWLTWAAMEDRLGDDMRAIEIRNMCAQQMAEASVGTSDLSPVAAIGMDGTLRPLLKQLSSLLGLEAPKERSDDEDEFDTSELSDAELMYGEFSTATGDAEEA